MLWVSLTCQIFILDYAVSDFKSDLSFLISKICQRKDKAKIQYVQNTYMLL